MKTLIAAALVSLALAGVAKAETGPYAGSGLPTWAQKALGTTA